VVSGGPCGSASTPPRRYQHVIWIIMENKSYSSVIGSPDAPYETQLAHQCASGTHWSDAGRQYDSLPNYIAMTTGQSGSILAPFTCDCAPSPSVSVTVDNIFRQVRTAGGTERSYAEGMSGNCSDSGVTYAPKHNPALYMWGGADRTACQQDAIPMGSATAGNLINALNGNTLPTYSLVAPNLCNDTHNSGCGVSTGDQFLKTLLPHVFASQAYRSGTTAVFVVWDEDSYIPNIVIAPSVIPGTAASTAVNHYGLLRATEEMLGLPLLGNAARATSLRTVFHI
jgi:phosphatidylinositol-3-phosphatase